MLEIVEPSVTLVSYTPDPEALIASMARICYQSEPEPKAGETIKAVNDRLLRRLIKAGHTSQIEHASASFVVVTDRGVTHEFVRHRIGISYSQESTRFVDYQKHGVQVIEPPDLVESAAVAWLSSVRLSANTYFGLRASGVPPQLARSVLPTCLKTTIGVTANFRAWRHFCALRTDKAAHPQMRQVADMILVELRRIAPVVFETLPPGPRNHCHLGDAHACSRRAIDGPPAHHALLCDVQAIRARADVAAGIPRPCHTGDGIH